MLEIPPPDIRIRSSDVPPTATAQHKGAFIRDGKVHFYKRQDVVESEFDWYHIVAPYRPKEPLDGPLYVRVCLAWPYTAATPKRVRERKAVVPIDRRPDLDNLLKSLLDVLTRAAIIAEDARIAVLLAAKVRTPHGGVSIDIGRLPRTFDSFTPEEQLEQIQLPLFDLIKETKEGPREP